MNSFLWRVSRLVIWIRPMFVDRLLFTALTARKSKRFFLKYALEREFHDDNEYVMRRWLLISFRKTVSKFVPKKSDTTIKRFRKPSCVLTKKLSYMRDFSMMKGKGIRQLKKPLILTFPLLSLNIISEWFSFRTWSKQQGVVQHWLPYAVGN